MGVLQDSEDHAVEEFEEVLKKRADVAALDRALAEHNEIMLSRALVIACSHHDKGASMTVSKATRRSDPITREVWVVEGYSGGWYPTYGEAYTNKSHAEEAMKKLTGRRRVVLYTPERGKTAASFRETAQRNAEIPYTPTVHVVADANAVIVDAGMMAVESAAA